MYKNSLLKLFLVLCFIFLGLFIYLKKSEKSIKSNGETQFNGTVVINNLKIPVMVADNEREREKGLSGKLSDELPENSGMLFVFNKPVLPIFWMIDMNFPLDFIWIYDNQIIYINKNVPNPGPGTPSDQLPKYYPPREVTSVLEVHAGFIERHGLKVGDTLLIERK